MGFYKGVDSSSDPEHLGHIALRRQPRHAQGLMDVCGKKWGQIAPFETLEIANFSVQNYTSEPNRAESFFFFSTKNVIRHRSH